MRLSSLTLLLFLLLTVGLSPAAWAQTSPAESPPPHRDLDVLTLCMLGGGEVKSGVGLQYLFGVQDTAFVKARFDNWLALDLSLDFLVERNRQAYQLSQLRPTFGLIWAAAVTDIWVLYPKLYIAAPMKIYSGTPTLDDVARDKTGIDYGFGAGTLLRFGKFTLVGEVTTFRQLGKALWRLGAGIAF